MSKKDRWFTEQPGRIDGWPVKFVEREEIDARFKGGFALAWYTLRKRFERFCAGSAQILSAFR